MLIDLLIKNQRMTDPLYPVLLSSLIILLISFLALIHPFLGTYSSILLIYVQLVIGTSRYKREHWPVVLPPDWHPYIKGYSLRDYCSVVS